MNHQSSIINHQSSIVLPLVCALWAFGSIGRGAELDLKTIFREGIPVSPFANVVYGYVNAMLDHGRDAYGPQKSGLFLSALDRKTLAPLTTCPPAPAGVPSVGCAGPRGGPLVGANPQTDQNLLRLLYFLKGLSGEDRYAQAADAELRWFLKNTPSPQTGLLPWGAHLSWNVMTDEVACGTEQPLHEFCRPWMLWERCFELAPDESRRFALALWNRHVVDQKTGALSRSALFDGGTSRPAADCPRQAGFFIRTWAEAYAHTKDEAFLKMIDVVLRRYEGKRDQAGRLPGVDPGSTSACDLLSLAIDCDGAARKVPEPLRTRLTTSATRLDESLCSLPHDLKGKQGFALRLDPAAAGPDVAYTSLWDAGRDRPTTAAVGMMCVSRYENTGRVAYRTFIVAAADAYLDSLPGAQTDAWPLSFGQAISLELAAFRATAQKAYYARAFKLGEFAVQGFFAGSPLPRASLKSDHYESVTGADTLALALAELHLQVLHITAVRTPANTIDH